MKLQASFVVEFPPGFSPFDLPAPDGLDAPPPYTVYENDMRKASRDYAALMAWEAGDPKRRSVVAIEAARGAPNGPRHVEKGILEMEAQKKPRTPREGEGFDPEFVRDISERAYRSRLEDSSGGGNGAVQRMIDDDGDNGEKLRARSQSYDALTRVYLIALGYKPPREVPRT